MPHTTERRTVQIVGSCSIVILIMTVFYPAGYDQHTFSLGGELVRNGAVPYRDFLDTKPPIIFYIYALASTIFGNYDWSIRILDAVYQIIAMWLFYKLLTTNGISKTTGIFSVFIYTAIYAGAGYWMTAQAETFALIPALIATGAALSFERGAGSAVRQGLIVGLLGAVLFLLKYTLLVVPAGIILWLFARNPELKEKLKFTFVTAASLAGGIAVYISYLALSNGLEMWIGSIGWLGGYSSIEPLLSPQVAIDRYLKLFQLVSGEVFTFSMIACCAIGFYSYYSARENGRSNALLSLLVIQLGIGILATLYERKLFQYHFLKFLWAFAPFAALGLIEVAKRVRASWQSSGNVVKRGFILVFVGMFLFYSPVLALRQPLRWTYYRMTGVDEADILDNNGGALPLKEMRLMANNLRPMLKDSDNIFFWGNHVGIYPLLNKLPQTISLTNTPLSTSWTPQSWLDKLYSQLSVAPPDYIVIETNDFYPFINGSELDSYDRLREDAFLRSFLDTLYDSLFVTERFNVYKRN